MPPADDQVALARVVSVLFEAATFIFKLNAEVLPSSGLNLDFGLAVGKPRLHRLNDEAQRWAIMLKSTITPISLTGS